MPRLTRASPLALGTRLADSRFLPRHVSRRPHRLLWKARRESEASAGRPSTPEFRLWRFAGPMPRPGRDLQRSSRGHHRGRESNGCLCPVGVAMAEVGDDETVTLLFARNDRPERPSIGRLCLCTAPRIATMSLVAGSAASRPYSSRIPSELPRRTGGSLAFVRSVGCD